MKSKSLAAVLALASPAAASPDARAEADEDPRGDSASPVASTAPPSNRPLGDQGQRRTRLRAGGGRRLKRAYPQRRQQSAAALFASSSTPSASAPGCGPSPGTFHSPYLGCYVDKVGDRALPFELFAGMSRNKRLGHGALDCERHCSQRGYRYFAREYRGQCFCGNNDLGRITRHGATSGCNCCGGNVGPGKMCLWENANHPDSQAELPKLPAILPQQSKPVPETIIPPKYSHLAVSSSSWSSNSHQSAPSSNENNPVTYTHKPTGAFRLRLYWERGYNWQNDPREQRYCMECRGECRSGASMQVHDCDESVRQKFLAVARTIRPATNPTLCLSVTGYGGTTSPVRLRRCDRRNDQNFLEVSSANKFELQPQNNRERCLSQHHHPKPGEAVFPESCVKTRKFTTTYWNVY
ncbi:hypothetical protein ACHAWF_010121 [Thalassiosira exigua]